MLALTADVIRFNPSNYTAWQFRRICLYELQHDLAAELDGVSFFFSLSLISAAHPHTSTLVIQFVFDIGPKNPKNYQLWHHRRACAERLAAAAGDNQAALAAIGKRELDMAQEHVTLDEKNLHAWAHRQWAVEHFRVWADELAFVNGVIDNDVRNNSAWNHRFFVVTHQLPDAALRRDEALFALAAIGKAPNNESAWSFLRGVLISDKSARLRVAEGDSLNEIVDHVETQARSFAQRLPACVFAVSLQVDLIEWRLTTLGGIGALADANTNNSDDSVEAPLVSKSNDREALRRRALTLCEVLREKRDVMHASYWVYREVQLKKGELSA